MGHRLAADLHRARADIAARLPQAAESTMEKTHAAAGDPQRLHPGVRRFIQKAGL